MGDEKSRIYDKFVKDWSNVMVSLKYQLDRDTDVQLNITPEVCVVLFLKV